VRILEDLDDFVDLKGAMKRWTVSRSACSGEDLLDLYERTVIQLSELEFEAAHALNVPGLAGAMRTHSDVNRRLASAYASLARTVLRS